MESKLLTFEDFATRFACLVGTESVVSQGELEIESLTDSSKGFTIGLALVGNSKCLVVEHDDELSTILPKSMGYKAEQVETDAGDSHLGFLFFKSTKKVDSEIELHLLYILAIDFLKKKSFAKSLTRFYDLFEEPADRRAETIGLIGELLYILSSSQPDSTIETWHSDINDRYDFSQSGEFVDVKTTLNVDRIHSISKAQIESADNVKIASVLLAVVEKGSNLFDLLRLLKAKLSRDSKIKLDLIISKMDIKNRASAKDLYFDIAQSTNSIKTYNVPFFEHSTEPGVVDYTIKFNFSELERNLTKQAIPEKPLTKKPKNLKS